MRIDAQRAILDASARPAAELVLATVNNLAFEVAICDVSSDRQVSGWWPEDRPLPKRGDVIQLLHPDFAPNGARATVIEVSETYLPGSEAQDSRWDRTLPFWIKTAWVFVDLKPIDSEARSVKPVLSLVKELKK